MNIEVVPSYSRAGRTAATLSGSLKATDALKEKMKQYQRKDTAERAKTEPFDKETRDQLAKVLGDAGQDASQSMLLGDEWRGDRGREHELCSSPRAPTQWKLETEVREEGAVLARKPLALDDLLFQEDEAKNATKKGVSSEDLQPERLLEERGIVRPSATFLGPARRDEYTDRSGNPEIGRYDARITATTKRAPQAIIRDRSLWRNKEFVDERDFTESSRQDAHLQMVKLELLTGRESKVSGEGQRGTLDLMYESKDVAQKRVVCNVDISKMPGREDYREDRKNKEPQPVYARIAYHTNWLDPSPKFKTVAAMGNFALLDKALPRAKSPTFAVAPQGIPYRDTAMSYDSGLDHGHASLDFSWSLPREKCAESVRARSRIKGGGGGEGSMKDKDPIRPSGNTNKVVPFSKLLPRKGMERHSDAPLDTVYHSDKAWEASRAHRSHSPEFRRMMGRSPAGAEMVTAGAHVSYPSVALIKTHIPGVDMTKHIGHSDPSTWSAAMAGRQSAEPISNSGQSAQKKGLPWHPADAETLLRRACTTDLSLGGKHRIPPQKKSAIDKFYPTEGALKYLSRATKNVSLGQGGAVTSGSGRNQHEMRVERLRLEDEIKSLQASKAALA